MTRKIIICRLKIKYTTILKFQNRRNKSPFRITIRISGCVQIHLSPYTIVVILLPERDVFIHKKHLRLC